MNGSIIPYIPANAPFSKEQQAYLNGYLAAMFSNASQTMAMPQAQPTNGISAQSKPKTKITILYGSQTGTSENLSKQLHKEASKLGFDSTLVNMIDYSAEKLAADRNVILITSTYGNGEPPDNAALLLTELKKEGAPSLAEVNYAIFGLGDSNYEQFCLCSKEFDTCMKSLGAKPLADRIDCDGDPDTLFIKWKGELLKSIAEADGSSAQELSESLSVGAGGGLVTSEKEGFFEEKETHLSTHNKKNPFPATILNNYNLNGSPSSKETRHIELSLKGSGILYEAGDALGIFPANCPDAVESLLATTGFNPREIVYAPNGRKVSLKTAFTYFYDISNLNRFFLEKFQALCMSDYIYHLLKPENQDELNTFLSSRDILDLVMEFPLDNFSVGDFMEILKPLEPRLYSISSSPKMYNDEVHITVGVVRYEVNNRLKKGVCSTFLADRADWHSNIPVFTHRNPNFKLPQDPKKDVIMVGPGTGIAPFRAFIQDRAATKAPGKNWLFFGDQREKTDFLYRDELQSYCQDGLLHRCDTAFSRDQEQKVYVQTRMMENSKELYQWLNNGASFYICGDASRMASDVNKTLLEIIQKEGKMNESKAEDFLHLMKKEKRYQKDVY